MVTSDMLEETAYACTCEGAAAKGGRGLYGKLEFQFSPLFMRKTTLIGSTRRSLSSTVVASTSSRTEYSLRLDR